MQVNKVYRGLQGMQLPEQMVRKNEYNVRGGVEYSFMSTSLSRDVAMKYATTSQGGDCTKGMVYEVQMGMVDRGADFGWLSQCVPT